jgi:hypothetical protein
VLVASVRCAVSCLHLPRFRENPLWLDQCGSRGCGWSSTSPHLDGPLASAIRRDPFPGSDPARGVASSSPSACGAFSSPLEVAGSARPQCLGRTTTPAHHGRWRSCLSGDSLKQEKRAIKEAVSRQNPSPNFKRIVSGSINLHRVQTTHQLSTL